MQDDEAERQAKSDPPPDGMPPAVHRYLSQAFGRLSGQVEGSRVASERAEQASREVVGRVTVLEWHVFGSKPPPPVPATGAQAPGVSILGIPRPRPLDKRVSVTEAEADALHARELVRDARLEKVEAHILAQSKAMGVVAETPEDPAPSNSERRAAFLHSRSGRSFALKLVTLVLAAFTTVLTAYVAARQPQPVAPTSQGKLP